MNSYRCLVLSWTLLALGSGCLEEIQEESGETPYQGTSPPEGSVIALGTESDGGGHLAQLADRCAFGRPGDEPTRIVMLPQRDDAATAPFVVRGEVVGPETHWLGDQLFSDWVVSVDEVLYGRPDATIRLRQLGGETSGQAHWIAGDVRLEDGQRVLLFHVPTHRQTGPFANLTDGGACLTSSEVVSGSRAVDVPECVENRVPWQFPVLHPMCAGFWDALLTGEIENPGLWLELSDQAQISVSLVFQEVLSEHDPSLSNALDLAQELLDELCHGQLRDDDAMLAAELVAYFELVNRHAGDERFCTQPHDE